MPPPSATPPTPHPRALIPSPPRSPPQGQGKVTQELVDEVMKTFDESMAATVETQVKHRCELEGAMVDYRSSDGVWEFRMRDVKGRHFKDPKDAVEVSCEVRAHTRGPGGGGRGKGGRAAGTPPRRRAGPRTRPPRRPGRERGANGASAPNPPRRGASGRCTSGRR